MSYPRIRFPHGDPGKVRVKRGRGPRVAPPDLAGPGVMPGGSLLRQYAPSGGDQSIKEEETPYKAETD